jgi:hypothetical protein
MFFENFVVGKLYYPIKSNISILIVWIFYLLFFLFLNPTLIYLFSYKIALLLTMTIM